MRSRFLQRLIAAMLVVVFSATSCKTPNKKDSSDTSFIDPTVLEAFNSLSEGEKSLITTIMYEDKKLYEDEGWKIFRSFGQEVSYADFMKDRDQNKHQKYFYLPPGSKFAFKRNLEIRPSTSEMVITVAAFLWEKESDTGLQIDGYQEILSFSETAPRADKQIVANDQGRKAFLQKLANLENQGRGGNNIGTGPSANYSNLAYYIARVIGPTLFMLLSWKIAFKYALNHPFKPSPLKLSLSLATAIFFTWFVYIDMGNVPSKCTNLLNKAGFESTYLPYFFDDTMTICRLFIFSKYQNKMLQITNKNTKFRYLPDNSNFSNIITFYSVSSAPPKHRFGDFFNQLLDNPETLFKSQQAIKIGFGENLKIENYDHVLNIMDSLITNSKYSGIPKIVEVEFDRDMPVEVAKKVAKLITIPALVNIDILKISNRNSNRKTSCSIEVENLTSTLSIEFNNEFSIQEFDNIVKCFNEKVALIK